MNPYIRLPNVPIVTGRQDLIIDKCKDKCVLHLGCVDSGLLYERFERGELMHQKLSGVAKEIWGIDIDADGISYLRSKGFDNLIIGDISNLAPLETLRQRSFDVVVASEVIEHLQNPGQFLHSIKSLMKPEKTELIITVPNAFRIDNLIWMFRGVEYVHPDHNYWFSYHTATNLLKKNNFEISQVYVYTLQSTGIFRANNRLVLEKKNATTCKGKIGKTPSRSMSFPKIVLSCLRSLPKRLLAYFLLRRTPFWGDGIIIITKSASND